MNGKQHLTTGVTCAALDIAIYAKITRDWSDEIAVNAIKSFAEFVIPRGLVNIIPGCMLFMFGLLFPDCDNKRSILGRIIHIPIEHRTWVHTVWFMLPFFLLGLLYRPMLLFVYGYFLHLLFDSPSRQGVCWFNPYGYKHYNKAKIKRGHFIYLYRSEAQAWILCGILIASAAFYSLGAFNILSPFSECVNTIDSTVESIVHNVIATVSRFLH